MLETSDTSDTGASGASGASGQPLIVWSAGEASGDRHAARVVEALRRLDPALRSVGLGGPEMAAAGVELLASMDEVSVIGLTEVVRRLPRIVRVWWRLRRALCAGRPALFVAVDFPGLNLRLAATARRCGVPVVYFIAPQVWAWGARRVDRIRQLVRRMLVVLPFEAPLFAAAGVPVTLVGHPLVEQVARVPDRARSRRALGLDPEIPVLVLMPGSRPSELRYLLSPLLASAARLAAARPALRVLVRVAPGLRAAEIERAAARQRLAVELVGDGDPRAVRAADLAIVASGTATLETALLGTAMLIVYRVSPLTFAIARRLVRVDSVGLVNVVAGRRVVPELIQRELQVERLTALAGALLDEPAARAAQRAALAAVAGSLGEAGAAERAARAILAELGRAPRGPGAAAARQAGVR